MSIGNTKDAGNKGNNFPYQRAVTKLLSDIACSAAAAGGATELTLLAVLAALQNGQEFEQNIVTDLGGVGCPANCPTYLQIRIFDTVTHTFGAPIYYDASGAVVVPVGPLELVNPQFVLNSILTQVTAINADLDVALSTRASEATLLLIQTAVQSIDADIDVALSTRASEATLLLIKAKTDNLDVLLSTRASETTLLSLDAKFTGVTRTPSYIQAVAAGVVAAGARSVSVYNSGTTSGVWLGTAIQPGVQLNFDAGGEDDVLGAFAYTASATATLEIATIV